MGEGAKRINRKPTFFWQGVLILAPVLVLATVGAYALWKEQRLAMHEAEGRAIDLADEAAERIWNELQNLQPASTSSTSAAAERIEYDRAGKLLFPKPYERVPIPHPLDDRELNGEQRRLWIEARANEFNDGAALEFRDLAKRYEAFLVVNPPESFAAIAHYNRGLALEREGQLREAAEEFSVITNRYPAALSESGLPLDLLARGHIQPLAEYQRYALEHPCSITLQLIEQPPPATLRGVAGSSAGQAAALALWKEQEQLRRLAEAVRPFFRTNRMTALVASASSVAPIADQITTPPFFWVTTYEEQSATNSSSGMNSSEANWLLSRTTTADGFALLPHTERTVRNLVQTALDRSSKPEWMDFTVTLAGRE